MVVKSDPLHCDFCYTVLTESSPHKDYPCKDFALPWPNNHSLGTWMACPECAALVDADRYDALIKRVIDTDFKHLIDGLHEPQIDIIVLLLKETYRRFKANRLPSEVVVKTRPPFHVSEED